MSAGEPSTLTAAEVARRLGVKLDTIYAYVSRGLLTRVEGTDKQSRFDAAQVERLAVKGRRSATPKLQPLVVTSELTEVTDDALFYRGRDAIALAQSEPFERVAEWLWSVPDAEAAPFVASRAAVALARTVQAALPEDALPLDRLRVIATVLGTTDPLRYETSPGPVVAAGRGLIAGLIESLPRQGAPAGRSGAAPGVAPSLAERLLLQLTAAKPSRARIHVLDVAMGLCADHALSPSTLAVRIAAGQRADPYGVIQTGLGALSGALHGAASLSAEELLAEVEAGAEPSQVIGARLRRGERIPGFGHALHPQGDPRARALLELVRAAFERSRGVLATTELQAVMASRGLPAPNIDFALASLARASGAIRGASEAIIAIARIAGWIAHALEEYRSPTSFPWRALYIGPANTATGKLA
jgi:citrate synthase